MDTNTSQNLIVYTPESQIRNPINLIRSMWVDLRKSHELSYRLFVRDLSAQYRQSLLGILWAFAPPIITSAIFIALQSRRIINFGETDIPYPLYVLIGTLIWQIFTESLNAPLKTVTAAKPLLVKINFAREALIISAFYLVLFNTAIKLLIIIAVILIFQVQFSFWMLAALIPIFMLILLGFCIGLLITPAGMLYTDIATSLPIATQLLFFVTPVVYPIPETFPFSLISYFNPVSPLILTARDLITRGIFSQPIPFLIVSLLTLVGLFIAWIIYRLALPIIIERISA
ncbi:MAG: ABC transporter permease [Aliifodinibius sp.]|nr:ABC transporter permease [candidate division Zixibacteria bacterium]NIT61670.1 ABC transporter permease [Fodinibius sp.]NIV16295.1 ABC transporter permease [Fodinibius sp.]NIY30250.1 ABC transporter permease [Fodinibius sp.]